MALKMTKRGQLDNEVAYEFVCDTTADLQAIDPKYVTMGSVATVIEGDAGFEVYMANSQKEWVNLGSAANSGGDSSGNNNNENNQNNEYIEPNKILLGPYTGKIIDYENVEAVQRNIVISNNAITGEINTYHDRLYLQVSTANYYLTSYYAYPGTMIDSTKNIYFLVSGAYETSLVHLVQDNVLEVDLAEGTNMYLYIAKFTPIEFQTFLTLEEGTTEYIQQISTHTIEEYNFSQIQRISSEEWDQAGE